MPYKNKELARKARREWYYRNKQASINAVAERKRELRKWLKDYKKTLSCTVCGENHWSCLEFHHPNPEEKDCDPAYLISKKGYSKERLLEELQKLVVLCANCHRKIHFP